MAGQRSYGRLQASHYWKTLEKFKADDSRLEHNFGTAVNSVGREDIRQICRYMNLNFRCTGEGSCKKISALKLDCIRERKRCEEMMLTAPGPVAGFFRGALDILAEHRLRVPALFMKYYAGERAWSLGEEQSLPPSAAATAAGEGSAGLEAKDNDGIDEDADGPAKKRRRLADGGDETTAAADDDEERAGDAASSSEDEDVEALLGRWVSVPLGWGVSS
eukprot:gnl/TRDRNA2_/TRDRNA2_189373_c0_seq1.p1 gnl/TRDRNA2_/TRDRNA2_189373_c0~~gnl/TRDRNA2_/TRDRNA2_189373_c0_seq1.p1  ORF type:complete len:239 (-),score=57.45 gnl/TRDRNA2_/TRDRNA2_189373_c0_seq1:37-693(-)